MAIAVVADFGGWTAETVADPDDLIERTAADEYWGSCGSYKDLDIICKPPRNARRIVEECRRSRRPGM